MKHPILVTGASGGIGEAVTRKLITHGYNVIALSRSMEKLQNKFKSESKCELVDYDLTDLKGIPSLIKTIAKKHGGLRGLIHAAGHDKLAPLYLVRQADIESLLAIHITSAILLCSQLAKKGNASNGCSIVLISSLSAHEGAVGHAAYAAAKGAIEGFLPSAAAELADKKIRLNVVIPGVVKTEMSAGFINRLSEEQKSELEKSYPFGLGEPDDIANAIRFLISDESKWISGQKFILDGGHLNRRV